MAAAQKAKKPPPTFAIVVVVVVMVGLAWTLRDFASAFSGTVTAKHDSGNLVTLTIREESGRTVETRVPKAQAVQVDIGEKVTKQRFSRAIRFERVEETTITE
jgi:hypothetical protein